MAKDEYDAFYNKKDTFSQNILIACDYDMWFVNVRVGWEGSAHDRRVLMNAICNISCTTS